MIRRLNRLLQDYLRPKRLAIGKMIWDKKTKKQNDLIKDNKIDMEKVKSIIVLRYDRKIGDMVITTSLFREIKKQYPNIKIGVVTGGAAVDIIKNNKNVDEIYLYDKKNDVKLAKEIAKEEYDILLDFSEVLKIKQMKFINQCKAKINIGINKKEWNLFDISVNQNEHYKVDDYILVRYGEFLKKLGIENYSLEYDIFLNTEKKYTEKYEVVLNPYGASKQKHFNKQTLRDIIKEVNKLEKSIVIVYSPDKYDELKSFLSENKDLEVKLAENIISILDTAEIIEKANLIITPDTSIVHIASALKKKIISVYPPNGGLNEVDHLVWRPLDLGNRMLFCQKHDGVGKVIDINTFSMNELKKELKKYKLR